MTSPPKTTEQAGNKPSRVVFRIDNLDCATEESLLRNALSSLPEVKELGFDLMKRELTVDHTFAGASEISQRIIAIGMVPALLDGNAQRKNILGADVPGISKGVIASMVIAGVAAIGAEVVAYVTGAERSVPVMALAVLAIALSGRDTLRKGWIALKNLTLNINLLMTVAVIGAPAQASRVP